MIFSRLKLHGFKSFVDHAEFLIEPGLTGIVGPNGCGKSNLVEALRWVMGENSYKNMRASGMDDVIFSGNTTRPARNIAEVTLTIDNSSRAAPAAFNQAEILEVTRRIQRDGGSIYRVNGREVRARDVQLLFADASSGARSPAMVRQGQIGEIIAAKPQARRRILEEAAGVSGLYSRRHEAEMRLRGAEENLHRLEDILHQLRQQSLSLDEQARQAAEYRAISAEIRRLEALLLLLAHGDAESAVSQIRSQLGKSRLTLEDKIIQEARAAREQAEAAALLPNLREAEARCGAALQRLALARQELDQQEKQARLRTEELARQMVQIEKDQAREQALVADADAMLAQLAAQKQELAQISLDHGAEEALAAAVRDEEARSAEAEQSLGQVQAEWAQRQAELGLARKASADETQRLTRLTAEFERVLAEEAALPPPAYEEARQLATALEAALAQQQQLDSDIAANEQTLAEQNRQDLELRGRLRTSEQKAQQLETECRTLTKMLAAPVQQHGPRIIDEIAAEKGYEVALGAALGDDIEASLQEKAARHWVLNELRDNPPLPEGATPLSQFIRAPRPLLQRISQIGLVPRALGPALRHQLAQGQRLVSREGDLWRWDGFTAAANAPTPAALRLVEKNRLGDLTRSAATARTEADALQQLAQNLQEHIRTLTQQQQSLRGQMRESVRMSEAARSELAAFERRQSQVEARRAALVGTKARIDTDLAEARTRLAQFDADCVRLGAPDGLEHKLDAARQSAAAARERLVDARGALARLVQDRQAHIRRLRDTERDLASWTERRQGAADQAREFDIRLIAARAEHSAMLAAPHQLEQSRLRLAEEMKTADQALRNANDARARGEFNLAEADRAARLAQSQVADIKEEIARYETRLEAAELRLAEIVAHIGESLQSAPDELKALSGLAENEAPDSRAAERQLSQLRQAREKLGAVNLRADIELAEVTARRESLQREHDDLIEAIQRLRLAIQTLNREGRQRLLAAFDQVNEHFKILFTTLFGGGAAELQLVESEDPLEAGLEILARPPGKKPQTMTLLSGGEQALTALSLIFAIFLTNPSPICVLDEVDAPLDDANVERFCDLLEEMSRRTTTRFLTITHNPITMARMNRLFGVTMAERGVSELVSVDLETAESLVEPA